MDPVVIGLTFLAIFVVELPDKTFLATLVLATKYRPILVWIGVGLAFAVQTTVAVLLGHAVSFLPDDVVQAAAALMFLVGAVDPDPRGPQPPGRRGRARSRPRTCTGCRP